MSDKKVDQLFEGDLTFDRSTVRQYLYEYHVKRLRMSNVRAYKPFMHYIVAKATKDLILLTGKHELRLSEIETIIDKKVLLRFMNEMLNEANI